MCVSMWGCGGGVGECVGVGGGCDCVWGWGCECGGVSVWGGGV